MRIGNLGSGLMGAKLCTLFARAGRQVIFGFTRTPDPAGERDSGHEPAHRFEFFADPATVDPE